MMKVLPRTCSGDYRETPSKTRRQNGPCWYFVHLGKRADSETWSVYTSFAEIRLKMSLEAILRWLRSRNPQTIYPHAARKSSRKPGIFRHFSTFPREHTRSCETENAVTQQIRHVPLWFSCHCQHRQRMREFKPCLETDQDSLILKIEDSNSYFLPAIYKKQFSTSGRKCTI